LCAAVLSLLPAFAGGQTVSPTMTDATVVARGALRFRSPMEWTHWNSVFGAGGKRTFPSGSILTTDVDVAALPLLAAAELDIRALTDSTSLSVSLGGLRTSADSRIASVPISLEYGLTSRLTVGLMVPIVQSRSVVTMQLNGRGDSSANIGVNPAGYFFSPAAFSANGQVTTGLRTARDQLAQRIATCAASPLSPGCPELNARSAEASALVESATDFFGAAITLYGVSVEDPGAPFVPLAGGPVQQAIDTRLADLRTAFSSFGINGGTGAFAAAEGVAANAQFQQLIQAERYGIGLDSIARTEQVTVGDIELAITARLFNTFTRASAARLQWRGAVAGVIRLGTGHPPRANRVFDVATGDGQTDVEVRGAVDVLVGSRLLTTVAATYTHQLGSVASERLRYPPDFILALNYPVRGSTRLGAMATARVNPRFLITPALMVGGILSVSHRGADETTITGPAPDGAAFGNSNPLNTAAAGLTLSYSNLASPAGTGDARFPAEIVFSHLETLRASASGAEKAFRDVIEIRFYFRSRR
jgi:hypothetical protein